MPGYTPIWRSILTSTIWLEKPHVKVVWLTMLFSSDRNGVVEGSVPGLAQHAVVSVDECRDALAILSAPDLESRTEEFEGRRIEKIDGGWRILNHRKHKEKLGETTESVRLRVAEHRERKRASSYVNNESNVTPPLHTTSNVRVTILDPRSEILDQDPDLRDPEESTRETRTPAVAVAPAAPKGAPRAPRSKPVLHKAPDSIEPTEATLAVAKATGRDLQADWAECRDWSHSNGKLKHDWQATLRNWMRRNAERSGPSKLSNQTPVPQPEQSPKVKRLVEHLRREFGTGPIEPEQQEKNAWGI